MVEQSIKLKNMRCAGIGSDTRKVFAKKMKRSERQEMKNLVREYLAENILDNSYAE